MSPGEKKSPLAVKEKYTHTTLVDRFIINNEYTQRYVRVFYYSYWKTPVSWDENIR